MKVVIDRPRLARRARLAHGASLGGLLAMLGSVALTTFRPDLATPGAVLLFAGFGCATLGIAAANRWVKRPRPEDILDGALKGLDDRHRLYHYGPGLPRHLLLGPSGLLVIECRSGDGEFHYRDGRWSQRITLGKALRFFVEEPLGDPIADARRDADLLARSLSLRLGREIPVRPLVVFTHPAASLTQRGAPIPVVQPRQLRGQAQRGTPALAAETYAAVRALLDAGAL